MKQPKAPEKTLPAPEKSKSLSNASKNSQSNSLRSQAQPNKVPCQSHFFQMQPNFQNGEVYYRQKVGFYFTHEMKEAHPYPVILQQFKEVEYLPLFGSENQIEGYRKHKNKYKASFYEQKSKASYDENIRRDIVTPIPRHVYCQICRLQFENYEKHVTQAGHLRALKDSFGNDIIDQFVDDYTNARKSDGSREEVAFLRSMISGMNEANLAFQAELRRYADEMWQFEKDHKK